MAMRTQVSGNMAMASLTHVQSTNPSISKLTPPQPCSAALEPLLAWYEDHEI
jgi:hypothetical protein